MFHRVDKMAAYSSNRMRTWQSALPLGGVSRVVALLCVTLCLLLQGVRGQGVPSSHLVLRPAVEGQRQVALLIVPEAKMAPAAYIELAINLQTVCPLTLGIAILDVDSGATDSAELLPLAIEQTRKELGSKGMDLKNLDLVLAGHGKGGHLVARHAYLVPELIRAVVLLGSHLPSPYLPSAFPVPVLTMSGDLDGLNRITRVAATFRDMLHDKTFDPALRSQNPLVVLEGYNHAIFSSGELPSAITHLDLPAEVGMQEGLRNIANLTSLFLAHTLQEPRDLALMAGDIFLEIFDRDALLMKPILKVQGMTKNEELSSYWVRVVQKWLSGLKGRDSTRLAVEAYVVGGAGVIPPTTMEENNLTYAITFFDLTPGEGQGQSEGQRSKGDDSDPEAPLEIAARLLSPERIHRALPSTSITRQYTCRDFNYASYLTAYHLASYTARARFDKSKMSVIFHDDELVQSDVAWVTSLLSVKEEGMRVHVTSPCYKTPMVEELGEFAGLHYCKLLPPDRALEWIYVDALRKRRHSMTSSRPPE